MLFNLYMKNVFSYMSEWGMTQIVRQTCCLDYFGINSESARKIRLFLDAILLFALKCAQEFYARRAEALF
jgi:hypothetical protein